MNKKQLHHWLVRLRAVRYAYLVAAVIVSGVVFIFAYRQNNLTALSLRDTLLQVDKDNGDVQGALNDLRTYTYGHMNARLDSGENGIYPPIQLKYTYERLVKAETDRVAASNQALYTEAQAFCEKQVTSRVTINRVPCIQQYLADHSTAAVRQIPDALYKFDFVAPAWSPDLAGWSLVVFGLLLLTLISRLGAEVWLRYQLRE